MAALRLGILCAVTLLLVPSPGAAAPFVRGDVDVSGGLDVSDVVRTLGSLFLGDGDLPCLDASDADDTGSLDLTDAVFLLNHLFLGGEPPPSPFPECGPDPSDDALTCERYDRPGGCSPDPFPPECNNVVARAAERGCGRVYVWGDEHVGSSTYWPQNKAFWRNAFAWLAEPSCGGAPRSRVSFRGVDPGPGFFNWLRGEGFTVVPWPGSPQRLDDVDILILQPFLPPQPDPGPPLESWVQSGGALLALTGGFYNRNQDLCESMNRAIRPLGLAFDCFHQAPWGPVTAFEDHPLAAGLSPDQAPFVNGANVIEVGGLESDAVARIGQECSPPEVPDCRFPIDFTGPAAGDTLRVVSDCEQALNGGVNLPTPGPELHVVAVYESSGADVVVRVERTEPMVLVLSANDAVVWFLEMAPGADVQRLIVNGNRKQTAFASPRVPVDLFDYEVNQNGLGAGFGFDCGGGETALLVTSLESLTGLSLRSFHGCYRAGSFTLR